MPIVPSKTRFCLPKVHLSCASAKTTVTQQPSNSTLELITDLGAQMLLGRRRAREAGTRLVHPLTQDHRYCQYAHTDGDGDWYDPRPQKSESGGNQAKRHFEKASEAGKVNALTFCSGPSTSSVAARI